MDAVRPASARRAVLAAAILLGVFAVSAAAGLSDAEKRGKRIYLEGTEPFRRPG